MNSLKSALLALACTLAVAGCDRPGEVQCRKAVENIRVLTGTSTADIGKNPNAVVRSCRATASKESVDCIAAAKTLAEVEKCGGEFAKKITAQLESEAKADEAPEGDKKSDE